MKLIQKQLFKNTREFEIIDDAVHVRKKGLLKEEKLTVGLSMLNPEPVINGPEMEFHSRTQHKPLLSLFLNKPDRQQFNAFVDTLKQRILGEDNAVAGVESVTPASSQPEAPGWNVYEEPPVFNEPGESREEISFQPVNPERVDDDIAMLKTYLAEDEIQPLLNSLETLKAEPQSAVAFQKVIDAFNELGFNQGAVLTYAPYLKVLLSKYLLS